MAAFIIRRLIISLIVIFVGVSLTFFLVHLIPGDPTGIFINPALPESVRQGLVERYGLSQPVALQYLKWLYNAVRLDFGYSFIYPEKTLSLIGDALVPTLALTLSSLFIGVLAGCFIGIASAMKKGTLFDRICSTAVMFFYSVPSFWLGLVLLLLLSYWLGIFPSSQIRSIHHEHLSFVGKVFDYIIHLLLPVTTLSLTLMASFAKYTRESMINALSSSYTIGAISRGIDKRKIIFKYCFKNSLIPVINLIGTAVPFIIGGAITVEVVFSLPGMGRLIVSSILSRDYPVVMGIATLMFFFVVFFNMLVDIISHIIDPRVQLQ